MRCFKIKKYFSLSLLRAGIVPALNSTSSSILVNTRIDYYFEPDGSLGKKFKIIDELNWMAETAPVLPLT